MKTLKYELSEEVVNYILTALNRINISGVQQAESLLQVIKILQKPLNNDELDKELYEALKNRFEKKEK